MGLFGGIAYTIGMSLATVKEAVDVVVDSPESISKSFSEGLNIFDEEVKKEEPKQQEDKLHKTENIWSSQTATNSKE